MNSELSRKPKVFVSGYFDLLHSGHIEFLRQASEYGELYVGIGSDVNYFDSKHRSPVYPERERLFMVKSVRYVKDAYINAGRGMLDYLPTLDVVKPDVFVVNDNGANAEKERVCRERGIQYVVLKRKSQDALESHSCHDLTSANCQLPTRLDLAGTWIDQPYVSQYGAGWALTISLLPTFEVRERCGLSTSTRNIIKSIWPYRLPDMQPEMLARLVFCFENHPEREDGIISGAQDSIGICIPGLCRHYYNNCFWPEKIETCHDEDILSWLESHLVMIPMDPRRPGCSVVEGKDITEPKVKALAQAADDCWNAIMAKDLKAFAKAYADSFNAQTAMFPGMVHPSLECKDESLESVKKVGSIQAVIDKWSAVSGVLAWKMPGAGGGGYLALVVEDAEQFCKEHPEAFTLTIRRAGM